MLIYNELLKAIKTVFKNHINTVKTLEIQRDQLKAFSKEKPLVLPAVYIDFKEFRWENYGHHIQNSPATITLQLAMESTTTDEKLFSLAQNIFETLENKVLGDGLTHRLNRITTRNIVKYDGVKVVEIDFGTQVFDHSLGRKNKFVRANKDVEVSY